jgi:hypothetical protein
MKNKDCCYSKTFQDSSTRYSPQPATTAEKEAMQCSMEEVNDDVAKDNNELAKANNVQAKDNTEALDSSQPEAQPT